MKRGFSGILGRFFARWYLESYHGLTHFVPINGEGAIVSHNVVVRRTGQFHLPDWICVDATGQPVLAESKGSHSRAEWPGVGTASPLKKAKTQLKKAVVQIRSPGTGRLRRLKTKGWAVMSRWSTVRNGCPPLLYALDPDTEGSEMTDEEASVAAQDIRRASLAGYMQALGHADLANRLAAPSLEEEVQLRAESDQAERQWASTQAGKLPASREAASPMFSDARARTVLPAKILMESIKVADDQLTDRRFIGGVIDLTGRLVPNPVSEVIKGRAAGPSGVFRDLYFAGIDVRALTAALEGASQPILSPLRTNRPASEAALPATSVLADGFVLTPIETLSTDVDSAPDELARPQS